MPINSGGLENGNNKREVFEFVQICIANTCVTTLYVLPFSVRVSFGFELGLAALRTPTSESAIWRTTGNGLQTMLERQKALNFTPEMQSKVTTNCDNSSGTKYKTRVLGGYILLKNDENAQKFI